MGRCPLRRQRDRLIEIARRRREVIHFHTDAGRRDQGRRRATPREGRDAQRQALGGVGDAKRPRQKCGRAVVLGCWSADEQEPRPPRMPRQRGRPFLLEIRLLRRHELGAGRLVIGERFVERVSANDDRAVGKT